MRQVCLPVSGGRPLQRCQAGMALAIVVWFIAGMSLLVAGIVSQASVDTRMAQLHVARAKVGAAGDGAVQLLLADLSASRKREAPENDGDGFSYRLGELDVSVSLVPTGGLIDLNSASSRVMAELFLQAGGVEPGEAAFLADSVVNWRRPASSRKSSKRGSARFEEIEDLLRVDGIGRTLLDGVRDYVVAGNAAVGSVDWSQAPAQVLAVLEKSDPAAYKQATRRAGKQAPGGFSLGGAYRADATVRYGGRTWLRRRWVVMGAGSNSMLGWRVVRSEAARVVAG